MQNEQLLRSQVNTAPVFGPSPTLLIDRHSEDLGGRKQIFGHEARLLRISEKRTPLPTSTQEPADMVTEGWYVSLPELDLLDGGNRRKASSILIAGSTPERVELQYTGCDSWGTAADAKIIWHSWYCDGQGKRVEYRTVDYQRIVALSTEGLDSRLFEIPSGFRRVDALKPSSSLPLRIRFTNMFAHLKRHVA
jgi:hypothetical protein